MNDGGPAFPVYPRHEGSMVSSVKDAIGMTLRDYFAAKAMNAYLTRRSEVLTSFDEISELSYKAADAMLKASLTKPESQG